MANTSNTAKPTKTEVPPGDAARAVMRACGRAALATTLAGHDRPYVSLVLAACDHDGTPILLLSTLAEHTKNLTAEPHVSLLYDATAGLEDPLTGARVSLVGRAERSTEPRHRARYLARHPSAAEYADFGDFDFYRIEIERAHLVAGFGRIDWIDAEDFLLKPAPALMAAESGIVAHMNEDHADAVADYAKHLLGRAGRGWRLTGIDPEGCDLRYKGAHARLDFAQKVTGPEDARAELVRLAKAARKK